MLLPKQLRIVINYRNNSEVTSIVASETKTGEDIKSSLFLEYLCNSGNQ